MSLEIGCLVSDCVHVMGGTDIIQEQAFLHLFPRGFCPCGFDEFLFDFAEVHGWDVQETRS